MPDAWATDHISQVKQVKHNLLIEKWIQGQSVRLAPGLKKAAG
jgi:hypothetical protein